MRHALKRLNTNWKRAKHWNTSPDPQYQQKNARDRLIAWARKPPSWAIGFGDEVWWGRFALPQMHAKPRQDHIHAAAVPLAGLTAWQALLEKAHVTAGQTVFILGAAGGVGHLAVQIAKSQGAYVFGTAFPRNIEFLHSIGVDHAPDYTMTPSENVVSDVDVVFDTEGTLAASGRVQPGPPPAHRER